MTEHDDQRVLLDPTAETDPVTRQRLAPPSDPATARIGLLSIAKERSDEFLDRVEAQLTGRRLDVRRFRKPTHTKPAPDAVLQDLVEQCDLVVEALAD